MKYCKYCGKNKPLNAFHNRKASPDGKSYKCKSCVKSYQTQYYEENPDKYQEQLDNRSQHYYDNKETYQENMRQWYSDNREDHIENQKEYYANNREERIKYIKEWEQNNKDKVRGYKRKSRLRFPEKFNAYARNRRARIKGASGSHTGEQWKKIKQYYGNKCLSCGSKKKLTTDHVIPIIDGGSNGPENLQPLCLSCNSSKGASTIDYRPDGGKYAASLGD